MDTIPAPHDVNALLGCLRVDGTMILVGAPPEAMAIQPFMLIGRRRSLIGSLVGGIRQTQDMLDHCAAHGITSDIERVAPAQINDAYERVLKQWPDPNRRHRIEHCSLVNPSLLARIKAIGAIPTPFWTYVYYHGEKWQQYGEEIDERGLTEQNWAEHREVGEARDREDLEGPHALDVGAAQEGAAQIRRAAEGEQVE